MCRMNIVNCVDRIKQNWTSLLCIITLSPFKHCLVTPKILPELQFRLNETSNHFIQGSGGGRGRGRPLALGMNQHTA